MPVAPQRTERFDITNLQSNQLVVWQGIPLTTTEIQSISQLQRTDLMIEMRNAGMWFTDIARIFGYPSASSASAHYIRECRLRGVEPRLRAQRGTSTSSATIPDFVNRVVTGERDFTFGVEIECNQIGLARAQVAVESVGQNCYNNGYTHNHTDTWKVVSDSSIRGRGPAEVVSRVLKGRNGFVEMRNVMLKLKENGARVNASCGMHIHLGVEHMTPRQRAMVIRLYSIFQEQFDLLIPAKRRNHNPYARHRSFSNAMLVAKQWASSRNQEDNRFQTLNLQSYQKYGTFEFRAHHGNTNPQVASAWIQLHMDFVQWCINIADQTTGGFGENGVDDFRILGNAVSVPAELKLPVQGDSNQLCDFMESRRITHGANRPSRGIAETLQNCVATMNVLMDTIVSNPAIKPILKKQIAKHNPTINNQ